MAGWPSSCTLLDPSFSLVLDLHRQCTGLQPELAIIADAEFSCMRQMHARANSTRKERQTDPPLL